MAPKTPPRKRPNRLNVTFTVETHEALERFSQATGIASAQLIRSIMHDAVPVIEAMTQAFAVVKTSPQQAADLMSEQLLRASMKAAQGKLELDEAVKEQKLRRRPRR